MQIQKTKIGHISPLLYGEKSKKLILAVHGSHSSKIDDCIWILAEEAVSAFAKQFHCELTEQPDGEHWFHTAEQLAEKTALIKQRLYG